MQAAVELDYEPDTLIRQVDVSIYTDDPASQFDPRIRSGSLGSKLDLINAPHSAMLLVVSACTRCHYF